MDEFKKGQEVIALLDEDHSLETPPVEHKAKFLGYHFGKEWADIELETEHKGGTKSLSVPVSILKALALILLLCGCSARRAQAQFIGYVSPQTVQATLASNLACTGSAQTFVTGSTAGFNNLGQTQHIVSISGTLLQTLTAEIDGIDVAGNVYRISDQLVLPVSTFPTGTASLSAFGYFPKIQVKVTCTPGTGTFTVTYSGSSSSANSPVGSYQVAQVQKSIASGVTAGSNFGATFQTPFGSSAGVLEFSYVSGNGPAGSTIGVTCADAAGTPVQVSYQFTPSVTAGIPDFFPVPAGFCPFVVVGYTAGGASANNFAAEYVFNASNLLTSTYMYNPTQLGVNALTEPAAGTSALSNIISTFAVKNARLSYSCTAGPITVNVQTYSADNGVAPTATTALQSPVSAVAAATFGDLYIDSESNPSVSTGTLATPPAGVVRFPQPYLAFSFTNAGGAGTCTARLFVTY